MVLSVEAVGFVDAGGFDDGSGSGCCDGSACCFDELKKKYPIFFILFGYDN